jgi:hypothetical protein
MTGSSSNAPTVLSAGNAIAGIWTAQSSSGNASRSGGKSRLEALTPLEREGARYGYRTAGRPFGPGREGLEIWLELRARGKED